MHGPISNDGNLYIDTPYETWLQGDRTGCVWDGGGGLNSPSYFQGYRRWKSASSFGAPSQFFPRKPTNWYGRYGSCFIGRFIAKGSFFGGAGYNPCVIGPPALPETWTRHVDHYYLQWHPTSDWFDSQYAYNTQLIDDVVYNIIDKMKDGSQVALGQNLAERGQLERLVVDGFKTIAAGVRNYKKLNPKDWGKLIKRWGDPASKWNVKRVKNQFIYQRKPRSSWIEDKGIEIPQSWLAYQYGVRPLVADINDSIKTIDRHQREGSYYVLVSDHLSRTTGRDTIRFDGGRYDDNITFTVDRHEFCEIKVVYTLNTDALTPLAEVGLANPLSLAYELTPWSFVLDWVFPIGNWLNSFDAYIGKSFEQGYRSNTVTHPETIGLVHINSSDNISILERAQPRYRYKAINRYALESFPAPHPPTFRNPCSPLHVSEALSLVATAFSR